MWVRRAAQLKMVTDMKTIVVVDYDSTWPETFGQIQSRIWTVVGGLATTVEHVGSTSVPGLAAKPIIDITVVVPAERDVPVAIERLSTLGYVHLGNLGIAGREAFRRPETQPLHHLYLCPSDSLALANHLAVRNYLRTHGEIAQEYGNLKKQLARRFPDDIDEYMEGKTDAILEILRLAGFQRGELEAIDRMNRRTVLLRASP
jgi:GrpB-like predicted nucleotidyltransferase (UPF0157 family)